MQQCQAAVDQLALFSNNEDADDIATAGQEHSLCFCVCWPTCIQFFELTNTELSLADLKYMLISAMHGDILAQTQVRDPEVRRHTLQSAVRHYSRCSLLPITSACFVKPASVK